MQEKGVELPDRLHLFGSQLQLETKHPDRDPVSLVLFREELAPDTGGTPVASNEHATGHRAAVFEVDSDTGFIFFISREAFPPLRLLLSTGVVYGALPSASCPTVEEMQVGFPRESKHT